MIPPLTIADLPTTGPTGERDNVARVLAVLGALLPPGLVSEGLVEHDAGCPCEAGGAALARCTCETVHLTVRAVDARRC